MSPVMGFYGVTQTYLGFLCGYLQRLGVNQIDCYLGTLTYVVRHDDFRVIALGL